MEFVLSRFLGYAFVYVQLAEEISDVKRQFSDINLKLNALNSQLPFGCQSHLVPK